MRIEPNRHNILISSERMEYTEKKILQRKYTLYKDKEVNINNNFPR